MSNVVDSACNYHCLYTNAIVTSSHRTLLAVKVGEMDEMNNLSWTLKLGFWMVKTSWVLNTALGIMSTTQSIKMHLHLHVFEVIYLNPLFIIMVIKALLVLYVDGSYYKKLWVTMGCEAFANYWSHC